MLQIVLHGVMTEDPDRYLRLRGGRWRYHCRVPERFAHLDGRVAIRIGLRDGIAGAYTEFLSRQAAR